MDDNSGWVRTISVRKPTLENNTADAERVKEALCELLETENVEIGMGLLRRLPGLLRKHDHRLRCLLSGDRGWKLLAALEPDGKEILAGIAVDLGTTRVVLRLINLESGDILGESAFDNPQIAVGSDILSRIHFAGEPEGLSELNRLIIDGLNRTTAALCGEAGIDTRDVYMFSVAGNTAMTHLFMGLDPRWMIREPYIPAVNRPGAVGAADLGIDGAECARVMIFPNIGSYFGGDLMAGILFSGLNNREEPALLVDVGTNAEVVLGNRDWLIACAGAAGPALEGGVAKMGMMAGPGVIDSVKKGAGDGVFSITTIGNEAPRGICGSGLIDLVARLYSAGMVDLRGKFVPAVCGERLKEIDGPAHFTVVAEEDTAHGRELTISQAEVDYFISSKAAMYTILENITGSVGMNLSELSAFFVAGTFGSFINPVSAITLGMLPDLPMEKFKSLGNSSLGGAAMVLLSASALEAVDSIRDCITYIELNVNQEFMNRFSAAKFIPHTDPSLFPSAGGKPGE